MNTESSEQLNVDPKDLECGVCLARYTSITKEPLIIIPCEHTICSFCFNKITRICPFCKAEVLERPIKNKLLSSLLETDSQVKKCPIHKQPLKRYCNKEKKLLCCECIDERHQDKSEPVEVIESKIKEIKDTVRKIHDKKEENKKDIYEKLQKGTLNLKRKLDDLYDEKLAIDFSNRKKVKRMIDAFMLTEKDLCEHQMLAQELSAYEENAQMVQERWRNSPEGNTAAQILEAPLIPKQAIEFYDDKAKQMSKALTEKEKSLEKIIMEPKDDLGESSKRLFDRISEKFLHLNPGIKLASKNRPEIARDYLLSTFEEHGFIVNYQKEEDCFELQSSTSKATLKKFYPNLFECSIEKLRFSCLSVSDTKFQVLCDILQNTSGLSDLMFSLKEPSSRKVEMISDLVLKSKTLQRFSFEMPFFFIEAHHASKESLKSLLNSKRISGFRADFTPKKVLIDFQQDLTQTAKAFEHFSAKFIGKSPLYEQVLSIMSSALSKTTNLRKVSLQFGDQIYYDGFLKSLSLVLNHSVYLQELDLGFAKVDLLQNHGLGQQVSKVIVNSNELRKVSLFLGGHELSEDVFDDLFYLKETKFCAGHKLEEFSLTIMRCRSVEIKELIYYLSSFPQLKRLIVRMNRVYIDFQRIRAFLETIHKLKSLVSFDFACRDFGQLTDDEKKDLRVCKYRLTEEKIRHKIVFELLESSHVPDYVDFLSEGNEEEGESESKSESEGNEEDYESDLEEEYEGEGESEDGEISEQIDEEF